MRRMEIQNLWNGALYRFVDVMNQQLFRNRNKKSWTEETIADLLPRWQAKNTQIAYAIERSESPARIIELLADSANYAMMMADIFETDLAAATYGKYLSQDDATV